MKKSVLFYLTHPCITISALLSKFSDRYAIEEQWKRNMDYPLDLDNPQTFCEKLAWLKLYDHNPLYTKLCDKLRVKEYVAELIGSEYVIPTLAVYKSVDEINLDNLPNQFVLKCNHDSGSVVICKDKKLFNFEQAKDFLQKALKQNYYWAAREWSYKNISPCIFAESYIDDRGRQELLDYKFFCFNGRPMLMYIGNDGAKLRDNATITTDFFDMDFNHLPLHLKDPNASILPTKPKLFEEMKTIAATLSSNIPFVRIDLYETSKGILFGEYTFYHNGGYCEIHPDDWKKKLGDMIILPVKR